MRLIIIDDVDCEDIADILGTRHECACVQAEEVTSEPISFNLGSLIGKKIQLDDPTDGYIRGSVDSVDVGYHKVLLSGREKWYDAKYISGIIS